MSSTVHLIYNARIFSVFCAFNLYIYIQCYGWYWFYFLTWQCYHQSVWPWKTLKTVDVFLFFFKEWKKEQKDKTSTFLKMRYCMICWAREAGSMCLDFVTNKPCHKHACEKDAQPTLQFQAVVGHVFLHLSAWRHVMRRTEGVSLTLVILGKLHSERHSGQPRLARTGLGIVGNQEH